MIVYLITNTVNGKQYIGMTKRTLDGRWNSHCSAARRNSPYRFHAAIRKYGEESFKREVLYENLEIGECRILEESVIVEYNTMSDGYNAKPGGCGGWIVPDDKYEEWKQKVSAAAFREGNGRWSGYSDEFILEECLKVFNGYADKEEFSFVGMLNKVREIHFGIPKSFSKNRFAKDNGFKNALAKTLGMSVEELIALSNKKSSFHKASLSSANIGNKWYSNDELKLAKQSKTHPENGWYRGRKYGTQN